MKRRIRLCAEHRDQTEADLRYVTRWLSAALQCPDMLEDELVNLRLIAGTRAPNCDPN